MGAKHSEVFVETGGHGHAYHTQDDMLQKQDMRVGENIEYWRFQGIMADARYAAGRITGRVPETGAFGNFTGDRLTAVTPS